jgi:hypothetical protein
MGKKEEEENQRNKKCKRWRKNKKCITFNNFLVSHVSVNLLPLLKYTSCTRVVNKIV